MIDVQAVRRDFPVLHRWSTGRPLVYLDSAATSQKPRAVIETVERYYRSTTPTCTGPSTRWVSGPRSRTRKRGRKVARFINAPGARAGRLHQNATEAINLVAYSWARGNLTAGDEIVVSPMEHHTNLVPWQLAARATGARLRFFEVTEDGRLRLDNLATSSPSGPGWWRSPNVQRAGHHQARGGDRRRGPADGRGGAGGRRPERAPHARGRAGSGLRFLRLLRPQDAGAHRRRRAVRPAGAAGRRWIRSWAAAT